MQLFTCCVLGIDSWGFRKSEMVFSGRIAKPTCRANSKTHLVEVYWGYLIVPCHKTANTKGAVLTLALAAIS